MNAITEKPLPAPADGAEPARLPTGRAVCAGSGARRRGWSPLIAIGVTASWWFTEGRYIESTDNAYVQGDIAVLSPRIEGDVAAIKVADNQRVHAGDPLIVLDPADWRPGSPRPPPPPPRPLPRWRRRSARSPSSRPRSTRRRRPSSRRRPSRRGPAPMRRDRDRWWPAAGPRARPTTRRSPTARKADAAVAAAQAQKAAAEQQLAVLQAQVIAGQGAPAERRGGGAAGREQPRLHRDPRAVRRHRRQPRGRTGPACHARHPAHRGGAAAASSSTSSPTSRRPSFAACSRA